SFLAQKKKQAEYRRSKAAREKEERRRKEQIETERREREKAEATAQALIEEFGLVAIMKIGDALNNWYVVCAIRKLVDAKCLDALQPHSAISGSPAPIEAVTP